MRRRCGRLVLVLLLAVAVFASLWREAVLTGLGRFLVVDEPRRSAEAIIVLSGSVPDRILEGVDLYRAGLAGHIILTREGAPPGLDALRARGGGMPERHELNIAIAEQLGVPREAIIVADGTASSTRTEAQLVAAHLRRARVRRVLLVTSKLHSRRAGAIFRSLLGDRAEITVCASHYDPFDPATWWHHRALLRRVVFEYQKLLVFELWERWTAPLTSGDD